MRKYAKSAFSLLELAVVVIIIGLISTALVKGVSIIRTSRLAAARQLTIDSKIGEIDGLIAWYETSMIESLKKSETTDDSTISAWYDISPGSITEQKNTLTKTAGSDFVYEIDGINSLPSMKTSSNGKISLSTFYQGTSGLMTVFIVFRPMAAPSSTQMVLLDSSTAGSTTTIGIKNDKVCLNMGSAVEAGNVNPPNFTASGNYILTTYVGGSAGSRVYVNEASTATGGTAGFAAGLHEITGLTVGANKSGSSAFTGLTSEIIIFNRFLSVNERKAVMAYLAKKYKIAVSGL